MPATVLLAELNLTATAISVGIGAVLLGGVGYLERRYLGASAGPDDGSAEADRTHTLDAVPAAGGPTSRLGLLGTPVADPAVVSATAVITAEVPVVTLPPPPAWRDAPALVEPSGGADVIDLTGEHPTPDLVTDEPTESRSVEPTTPARMEMHDGRRSDRPDEVAVAASDDPEDDLEDDFDDDLDEDGEPRTRLPRGAEAALLSIVEAVPDPRNTIAVKDPTAQVRLVAHEIAAAKALADPSISASATADPPAGDDFDAAVDAAVEAARRAARAASRRPAADDLRPGPPAEWGSRPVPILSTADEAPRRPAPVLDDAVR